MTKITITLSKDSEREITLSDLIREKGLPIDEQCKKGFCGTCRKVVIKGKIKYPIDPIAYFNEKTEALPCIGKVVGDKITVEFDTDRLSEEIKNKLFGNKRNRGTDNDGPSGP